MLIKILKLKDETIVISNKDLLEDIPESKTYNYKGKKCRILLSNKERKGVERMSALLEQATNSLDDTDWMYQEVLMLFGFKDF